MGMTRKFKTVDYEATLNLTVDVLPGMNAGASTYAGPSPIEGSGTAWVLLGSWALSPARPTPIHPRRERRGFSALLVILFNNAGVASSNGETPDTIEAMGEYAADFVRAL